MAGTYSKIYLQLVFTVKGREKLLNKPWREKVFKYISGNIDLKNQKSFIVNGTSDHIHVLVSISPSMKISDLVRDIKNNSSRYINEQNFISQKFFWQEGYGVFSYSHSEINKIYQYIAKQEKHHKSASFQEEYLNFMESYEIDYNRKYLFD